MTTRKMLIKEEPQQVITGKETAVIQFNGSLALCDSAAKPAAMYFPSDYRYQTITITPLYGPRSREKQLTW
ncbi:hypothetical protein QUQ58_004960 [Escherichia coli]|nr:hypothetical protein [Escherichia coli]